MSQITKKLPTNYHYSEKSVFMKEVNTQKFWSFELGIQEANNVLVGIYVVYQQSERQRDQNLKNDTFHIMPVTSAQVVIGTKNLFY